MAVVAAVRANGKCPFLDYRDAQRKKVQKKVDDLIMVVSDHHPLKNKEKYKKVEDGIYTLKPDNFHRIFCFQRRKKLVLANGYRKTKNKLDPKEIRKAKEIRQSYDGV